MNKVLVIGCPGAGKSTFSRKLARKTGLPLHYLDMLWHRPDRTTVAPDEFDRNLQKIFTTDRWIIDGNYIRTLDMRLNECDTVFFFNLPIDVCLAGVEARMGKPREDMPWTENEWDEEFRQWILDFPKDQLPLIRQLLESHKSNRRIIQFCSRQEADDFINTL
ncbi:hypothetical protein [uncultured Duncaniella sp.]|uniref:hypothetical protein n=1 Tax=uncultured Duncaniella sp. TaxID=2768039 RepID=UPI0025E377D6|nr:hypothetical protein [uncultured Duncaniella sp.]